MSLVVKTLTCASLTDCNSSHPDPSKSIRTRTNTTNLMLSKTLKVSLVDLTVREKKEGIIKII